MKKDFFNGRIGKVLTVVVSLLVVLAGLYVYYDEPLPEGEEGPEVARLTAKMLEAVNIAAWDTTVAIKWTFGKHHYLWDKKHDLVEVKWKDYRVLLNTDHLKGVAFEHDLQLTGSKAEDKLAEAWEFFANDSFWLAAPFKITDPGTRRKIVHRPEGDGLLVYYSSGGVTPGDTYLWILDEEGRPVAWKLWVKIIPVGGMRFSWEGWKTYETGARIATRHDGIIDVTISNVKLGMSIEEVNGGVNPFERFNVM